MIACALALILLVDVSGSVSAENHRLQREGIVEALRDRTLARLAEVDGPLAVTLIEWDSTQTTVLPWTILRSERDFHLAAETIMTAPRAGVFGSTHVGDAIWAGLRAAQEAPCAADRVVLDVSGDGANNGGSETADARDAAQAAGYQINGLPIITEAEPHLDDWFRANVLTEDGFLFVADGFENVARALRRKIIFEVASNRRRLAPPPLDQHLHAVGTKDARDQREGQHGPVTEARRYAQHARAEAQGQTER